MDFIGILVYSVLRDKEMHFFLKWTNKIFMLSWSAHPRLHFWQLWCLFEIHQQLEWRGNPVPGFSVLNLGTDLPSFACDVELQIYCFAVCCFMPQRVNNILAERGKEKVTANKLLYCRVTVHPGLCHIRLSVFGVCPRKKIHSPCSIPLCGIISWLPRTTLWKKFEIF